MRARMVGALVLACGGLLVAAAAGQSEPPSADPGHSDLAQEAREVVVEADDGEDADTPTPIADPPPPQVPTRDGMARVPGTTFRMGSVAKRAEPNESPARAVTVDGFWMDVIEVPVGAYAACVERGACALPVAESAHCTYGRGDPRLPMNCVTHGEATQFCLAAQKRLPTEAEWELAAHGTADRAFPWGEALPGCDVAVVMKGDHTAETCGREGPLPAGRPRGRSPYGIEDLAGNLEEWVADFYDDRYPPARSSPDLRPRGPSIGSAHVLRGGGWLTPRSGSRTTARSWASLSERGANVGFRCARGE